ncbi:MAG: hypothetical protein VCA36_07875, partial [Opitutales bacterium]
LGAFDRKSYRMALSPLMDRYEKEAGISIDSKRFESIGLKVQTANAPGLATPRALVDATIDLLLTRGFRLENLFLLDIQTRGLRAGGFLPSLSQDGDKYRGVTVKALAGGEYFRPAWFHESPLPPSPGHVVQVRLAYPNNFEAQRREGRRSYLPTPLMLGKVGWINLPVVKDSVSLGVEGAVANASLWNVGNNRRFLDRKSTAPAAAIEILAVPELWERQLFSVLSLEKFQYSGGRNFQAAYVTSRPTLYLSPNPIAIDAAALDVLRAEREKHDLLPRSKEQLLFQYARSLKLGDAREAKLVPVR